VVAAQVQVAAQVVAAQVVAAQAQVVASNTVEHLVFVLVDFV
jgi:hypothetical protein